ncbi:DUF779 domain-containing protein [Helicobacter sp. MIT 14-3879]|uniref:DUF779 domain-containing protein n=1 Tax=Helicobacter sp. MIT 14-3879 TaxID=2040649 RepID=UPI000E1EB82E|nr:DUF779 domain-containing protein [Helicobacter sp. MIT 14-3879]RDU63186.1 DUF779 domain-containing protein [Helicobacter sp. MIT 14-3879]
MLPKKVIATDSALKLIQSLKKEYKELIFYQSGGCCDGSTPYCYEKNDFKIGENDLLLGEIDSVPFYIHKAQYEYFKHTQLILNALEENGSEFSLEYGTGKSFILESRVFSNEEYKMLKEANQI